MNLPRKVLRATGTVPVLKGGRHMEHPPQTIFETP